MLGSLDQVDRLLRKIDRWAPHLGGQQVGTLSLSEWLHAVSPAYHWDWPYLLRLRSALEDVSSGKIKRLAVMMPPRHGKTALVTIRWPVWWMEKQPGLRVIVSAYNQTLANKFSRLSRRIAESRMGLSAERKAVEEWQTPSKSWYRAVGVGGGVTGMGGDLLIIDDPVKNREEAQSPVYRERVWEWYINDLYTRLEPNGAIVLVMTRWHEDDLIGRILGSASEKWDVLRFPALAEENDPLFRQVGEALCPDRYSRQELLSTQTVMGTWAFESLYQQRPMPAEGGLFKKSWFSNFLDAVPVQVTGRVRYWDKAATSGGGDYTVGARLSRTLENTIVVEEITRGQWSSGERDKIIRQCAETDPPNTSIYIEQEPGSSGVDSVQSLIRLLTGFTVHGDRVTGSKLIRAEPFAAQAEAGNVALVRAPWNSNFLEELSVFPNGSHDDQVDAASGAFSKLTRISQSIKARSYQG